jgi:hypothetical protein
MECGNRVVDFKILRHRSRKIDKTVCELHIKSHYSGVSEPLKMSGLRRGSTLTSAMPQIGSLQVEGIVVFRFEFPLFAELFLTFLFFCVFLYSCQRQRRGTF